MREQISDEELLAIAKQHKKHITSVTKWNDYRKTQKTKGLPHSQTFISRFGSWNAFKEMLSLDINNQSRPQTFTDVELIDILNEHKDHYTGITEWDNFADQNGLPKHALLLDRLGMDQVYDLTGFTSQWSKEQLERLILMHFPDKPPTQRECNDLSDQVNLPSYLTVIRRFGSCNSMKHSVYYK